MASGWEARGYAKYLTTMCVLALDPARSSNEADGYATLPGEFTLSLFAAQRGERSSALDGTHAVAGTCRIGTMGE